MPNWCINQLIVEGENLDNFISAATGENSDLSLEVLYPIPTELSTLTRRGGGMHFMLFPATIQEVPEDVTVRNTAEDRELSREEIENVWNTYGFLDWYDWRVSNWGTKWDIEAELVRDENRAIYGFESAWSPPETAVMLMSERWPKLKFTLHYWEPGCDFSGFITVENGQKTREEQGDGKFHAEYFGMSEIYEEE